MIEELLGVGEANAKTARELADITHLDVRDVTEMVRIERLSGAKICSSYKGFFMPENKTDIDRTVTSLHRRANEIRKSAEALSKPKEEK